MVSDRIFEFPADHARIAALFDRIQPNSPALWAVLLGRHQGMALVDDIHKPTQAVVRTDAALTYFGGDTDQTFLETAIARFRHEGPVLLVWPPETRRPIPFPESARLVQRVEFSYIDPESSLLAEWRHRVPEGFHIRFIDRTLLARCEWRDEMAFYCGSLENFLVHGIGLCLMRNDEIIVEAYASSLGKTMAEIGAITRETYRGRGYAPVACAHLIQACAERGYQAYWSCDEENLASRRVARKLGFGQEGAYRIIEYGALF